MKAVAHNGRTTAYRHRRGSDRGADVLCVHGSGGSHVIWRAQFRLSKTSSVAALDLSGHGESDDVDADPGYESLSAYTDDVVAVAQEVGASVLVGSSLGGAVVLNLALERDLDALGIEALVLAGSGARLAVFEDLLVWLDEEFEQAVDFLHGPDRLFHSRDERLLDDSRTAMLDAGQAVTQRDFLTSHQFDVRDQLGEISLPTLAVVGAHDQLTPPWYHEYLADELPHGTYAEIDDAAHLAMIEQPAAFNETIESFLSDQSL